MCRIAVVVHFEVFDFGHRLFLPNAQQTYVVPGPTRNRGRSPSKQDFDDGVPVACKPNPHIATIRRYPVPWVPPSRNS